MVVAKILHEITGLAQENCQIRIEMFVGHLLVLNFEAKPNERDWQICIRKPSIGSICTLHELLPLGVGISKRLVCLLCFSLSHF